MTRSLLIRYRDDAGSERLAVADDGSSSFTSLTDVADPVAWLQTRTPAAPGAEVVELHEIVGSSRLQLPVSPHEVWCSGVTYARSRDARMEESTVKDVYALVYEAERPEIFLKDARCRRTVGHGEPIAIRSDSSWNVPEPEIALVLGERGAILGYTIGNDVSSREIEGANPLYLPQAKIYAGSCSIGPAILAACSPHPVFEITLRVLDETGREVLAASTSTREMVRSFDELAGWLVRDNPVPAGSVLLTGTGLVPADDFTLRPGQTVEIHVPQIGTLSNPVVLASTLLEEPR